MKRFLGAYLPESEFANVERVAAARGGNMSSAQRLLLTLGVLVWDSLNDQLREREIGQQLVDIIMSSDHLPGAVDLNPEPLVRFLAGLEEKKDGSGEVAVKVE